MNENEHWYQVNINGVQTHQPEGQLVSRHGAGILYSDVCMHSHFCPCVKVEGEPPF